MYRRVGAFLLMLLLVFTAACTKEYELSPEAIKGISESEAGKELANWEIETGVNLYKRGVRRSRYAAGQYRYYDEPVDLTVISTLNLERYGNESGGLPEATKRWTDYLSSAVNVNWEFKWCEGTISDYNQKLILALVSNQLADVFQVFDATMIRELVDAGEVIDLTAVYQENANETLVNLLEENGLTYYGSGLCDGKLYALPIKVPESTDYSFCYIRRDWLKECGLEIPQTMDELMNAAEVFSDSFDDAVGMLFSKDYMTEMQGIFWAFGGTQNTSRWQWNLDDEGVLQFAELDESMKGGFEWLSEMYRKGLIPSESLYMNYEDAFMEYVASNRCGIFYGTADSAELLQYSAGYLDATADWIVIGLPMEESGQRAVIPKGETTIGWYCISKNCENPGAVIQSLNAYVEIMYGANNALYAYGASASNPLAWSASPVYMPDSGQDMEANRLLSENYNSEIGRMDEDKLSGTAKVYWDYIKSGISMYKYLYGPEYSFYTNINEGYEILKSDYPMPYTRTYSESWGDLLAILDEFEMEMIRGKISVDEGFRDMSDKWYASGGKIVTRDINTNYNTYRYYSNFPR